jgi:hypothetical protein
LLWSKFDFFSAGIKEENETLMNGMTSTTDPLDCSPQSNASDHLHEPIIIPHNASQAQTLVLLLAKLKEKRVESGRPEELNSMSREQVFEEKVAVQKALLHFESVHGRPSTKSEKELMRPLYDRYRQIKRLLSKPLSVSA